MLPAVWSTARLHLADATPADIDRVLQQLAESADMAARDPSFGPAPRDEVAALVARSAAEAAEARRGFQMQTIRRTDAAPGGDGQVGYWHLSRVPGRDGVVGVSILLIRPPHRRGGLGRELVDGAAAHLAAAGCHAFWARVFLANPRALAFWAGLGFERLARHHGRFVLTPDERPSIILERPLPAPGAGAAPPASAVAR